MAQRHPGPGLDHLARFLVAYRLLLYLGGLVAISLPLVLTWAFDVTLSPAARSTVVGVSFAVIVVTYLAERRVGLDHVDPVTGSPREAYSLRLRASLVLAIAGVALGAYLLLVGRWAMGALFLLGAVLFFQLAYRAERPTGGRGGGRAEEDDAEPP